MPSFKQKYDPKNPFPYKNGFPVMFEPFNRVKEVSRKKSMPKIKGRITDSNGTPIPLVNVSVESDSTRGTSTDFNGNYTLRVYPTEKIRIGYVGFKTLTKTAAALKPVEMLREETKSLNEVNLGTVKRTTAIEKPKSKNAFKWIAGGIVASVLLFAVRKRKQGLKAPENETLNVIL